MTFKPKAALARPSVTLEDVARAANVSPKTVSRVINGNDYVSDETYQLVTAAIERLGYVPNRAARSLVSDRTNTIGMTILDFDNPFCSEIFRAVEHTARQHDFNVLIFSTRGELALERQALRLFEEHRVDGVILHLAYPNEAYVKSFLSRRRAAVIIGQDPIYDGVGTMRVDFFDAAYRIVELLAHAGKRHLGCLRFPYTHYGYRERWRGLQAGAADFGLSLTDQIVPLNDSFVTPPGIEQTRRLLTRSPHLDSVVCFNDMLAIGVLDVCDELELSIPDQVSVIGFDDISFAGLKRIGLTTMRVPKYEMGVRAAEMLFDQLAGKAAPTDVVMKTELVLRDTTPPIEVDWQVGEVVRGAALMLPRCR